MIEDIKTRFLEELKGKKTSEEKRKICKKYLEEEMSSVFYSLKSLSGTEKTEMGKAANELKQFIAEEKEKLKKHEKEEKEWIDITLPGERVDLGTLHPLTRMQEKCKRIFSYMGFIAIEGPELENEWYNFDALNFTKDHPVREMQDTLFVKQKEREKLDSREKLLMRTQTSPVQVRYMEKHKPPLRVIVPGRVFRNEATDSSHEINFYQLEGLMVGEKISVANFKAVMESFFRQLLESDIEIRLRPSFFPFTEPSFEVDVSCSICKKRGCSTCQRTGWIEAVGAGMVHPNVLENSGVDPNKFTGFAFGAGLDRLVMIERKINDIRLFYGGDLRFLKQF